jgi:ribosomal protein S18 acetylase RimI-like enzyme
MPSDYTIRTATTADLGIIGELWKALMDFHRKRDEHFARSVDGHEKFKEFIAGQMSSGASCVLVAEQEGNVAGYCLATLAQHPPVFAERDHGHIWDLAVTESCRGRGLGEKMYRTVEKWFAERGVHRIETRVAVTNEISSAFWKEIGFRPYIETVCKDI